MCSTKLAAAVGLNCVVSTNRYYCRHYLVFVACKKAYCLSRKYSWVHNNVAWASKTARTFLNCREEICDFTCVFFWDFFCCDFLACFGLNWTCFFATPSASLKQQSFSFCLFHRYSVLRRPSLVDLQEYIMSCAVSPVARSSSCRYIHLLHWNRQFPQIVLSCTFCTFRGLFCTYRAVLSLLHWLTDVSSWLGKSLR